MSRKNIFEIVSGTFDLSRELKRMRRLFEKEITICENGNHYTLREYIKTNGFSRWSNRGHCVDMEDFLSSAYFEIMYRSALSNIEDLFTVIEIMYNFWHIAQKQTAAAFYQDEHGRNFVLLKTIMDDCLAHYNYKGEYFKDSEQLIVIEDKVEVTAVAEILGHELSFPVLRYNHYMLKGDLQGKKNILLTLGNDLEAKRSQIHDINKHLEDGLFFILNNLNLRHNNMVEGDKHYRKIVAEMDDATLEDWYDELYQMMLLAYLQLDQMDRNKKVIELKRLMGNR